jgi:cytochrome c peroxidase
VNSSVGIAAFVVGVAVAVAIGVASGSLTGQIRTTTSPDDPIKTSAVAMIDEGRNTFRFDTFGDETFWGDALKLHRAIVGGKLGGVGAGVSPQKALAVGLKVDAEALPADLVAKIKAGEVNMDDPATTVALLKLNAVVGVTAFFNATGVVNSMGIQCALCHSTVDDSFSPGIGKRLDGWPNRDLNVGAIIAMAPDLSPVTKLLGADEATVKKVLNAWGPGKFDAELFLDGKGFRPDGKTAATLIPPASGLAGVNLHTFEGFGSVTYWNAFVANLEMHGQGTFFDPRLNDPSRFPIAARARSGNTRATKDRITPKLAALHFYQLAIPAPSQKDRTQLVSMAREKSSDGNAQRGETLFGGKGKCSTCHVPPLFTEPGWNMHSPSEIGIDDFQANRSPDRKYRTTPLKGLWARQKGGFYHDGRFATLRDVVDHYDRVFKAGLTEVEKEDMVAYLLSL